jgi:hypothetical protein
MWMHACVCVCVCVCVSSRGEPLQACSADRCLFSTKGTTLLCECMCVCLFSWEATARCLFTVTVTTWLYECMRARACVCVFSWGATARCLFTATVTDSHLRTLHVHEMHLCWVNPAVSINIEKSRLRSKVMSPTWRNHSFTQESCYQHRKKQIQHSHKEESICATYRNPQNLMMKAVSSSSTISKAIY